MNIAFAGDKEFIRKLTEITLANLENEAFSGKEISREVGVSVTFLNKRLHIISQKTINQFIREVRLQKAMEMLQQELLTAAEVALKVGFGTPAYFNTCFSEFFGITPGEVKRRSLNGAVENGNGVSHPTESPVFEPVQSKSNSVLRKKQVWRAMLFAIPAILAIIVLIYFFDNSFFNSPKTAGERRLKNQEKSIAVLPFFNDSGDPENIYFINGVMESILNNLAAIKDLRVVSRNSIEKYRNNNIKSIPEIARELGVNYIVEASGQRIGNQIKITVQLIDGKTDKHFFSQPYERELEDIFALESEIAMSVASKIKAVITPEEIEIIEKKPTKNMAALNMYLQGVELIKIGDSEKNNALIQQAEILYRKAIQLDSTYIEPYVALGGHAFVRSNNLDSGIYLANRALHFDPKNADALGLKGWILNAKGLYNESKDILKQAIKYNPKKAVGYHLLGVSYAFTNDYALSIEYMLKALKLEKDAKEDEYNTLSAISGYLGLYGYPEEGLKFAQMLIEYNNDSVWYYLNMSSVDLQRHNYTSAYMNSLKGINLVKKREDFPNREAILSGPFVVTLYMKDYKRAVEYIEEKAEDNRKRGLKMDFNYYCGYAYLKNGQKEKADYHFEECINVAKYMLKTAEQNHTSPCFSHLYLACIYSGMDNKGKATENLRNAVKCKNLFIPVWDIIDLKNSPVFEIMRNEPEFRELVGNAEARQQPQMKKIEKLLKDYWSEN